MEGAVTKAERQKLFLLEKMSGEKENAGPLVEGKQEGVGSKKVTKTRKNKNAANKVKKTVAKPRLIKSKSGTKKEAGAVKRAKAGGAKVAKKGGRKPAEKKAPKSKVVDNESDKDEYEEELI